MVLDAQGKDCFQGQGYGPDGFITSPKRQCVPLVFRSSLHGMFWFQLSAVAVHLVDAAQSPRSFLA